MNAAFPHPPTSRKPLGTSTGGAANRHAGRSPAAFKPSAPPAPAFDLLSLASSVTQSVLGALDEVAAQIDDPPAPYEEYQPLAAASSYDEFVMPAAASDVAQSAGVRSAAKRRSASVPRNAEAAARGRGPSSATRGRSRARSPSPPPLLGLLSGVGATLGSAFESTLDAGRSGLSHGFELGRFGIEASVELVDRWLDDTIDSVLGPPKATPSKKPRAAPPAAQDSHGGAQPPQGSRGTSATNTAAIAAGASKAPWAFHMSALAILEAEAHARMRVLSAEPWLLLTQEGIAPDVSQAIPTALSSAQLEALLPMARAAIGGDDRLMTARQSLVPKRMNERSFWAAYLRRCLSIKREVTLEFGKHALALAGAAESAQPAQGAAEAQTGANGAVCAAVTEAQVAEAWAQELALTVPAAACA